MGAGGSARGGRHAAAAAAANSLHFLSRSKAPLTVAKCGSFLVPISPSALANALPGGSAAIHGQIDEFLLSKLVVHGQEISAVDGVLSKPEPSILVDSRPFQSPPEARPHIRSPPAAIRSLLRLCSLDRNGEKVRGNRHHFEAAVFCRHALKFGLDGGSCGFARDRSLRLELDDAHSLPLPFCAAAQCKALIYGLSCGRS
jgi:hypothetical protein